MNEPLPESQRSAIRFAVSIGRRIQDDFPGIADDFRKNSSVRRISIDYDVAKHYRTTPTVAFKAVSRALKGYGGELGDVPYDGLIPLGEFEELVTKHTKDVSDQQKKNGTGIFGLSKKELSDNGKEGGKKGGTTSYERGKGYHSFSPEEKRAQGQKAATNRGDVPWSDEEITVLLQLPNNPHYMRGKLRRTTSMAEFLNNKFHNNNPVRNCSSVSQAYRKYEPRIKK